MDRGKNPLGTKVLACLMSVVLAVGLTPLPAFAEAPAEDAPADLMAAAADLTAAAGPSIKSWSALQQALDDAEDGTTITLTGDLTATASDTWLVAPSYTEITIDLKGHTLNRGLSDESKGDGSAIFVPHGSSLTIQDTGNTEGLITGGNASQGGGILNEGRLTIEGGRIADNQANNGGGIMNYGSLTINGGTIQNNKAQDSGGGIANYNTRFDTVGRATIAGGTVIGNSAGRNGGGIYNNLGTLTITGGTIDGNKANTSDTGSGGGIYTSGSLNLQNAEVIRNEAKRGGGIYNGSNPAEYQAIIKNGKITKNSAVEGGGIYNGADGRDSKLDVSDSEVSANEASNGGGIFATGTIDLAGVTMAKNKASESGGGVFVEGGTTNVKSGSFTDNSAARYNGGAICVDRYGMLNLTGGTISNNYAQDKGGGIYADTTGGASFNIQDSPVVKDNTDWYRKDNVYLSSNSVMTLSGALADAQIGVTVEGKMGVITSNYTLYKSADGQVNAEAPKSPSKWFVSDEGLSVSLDYTQGLNAEVIIQEMLGRSLSVVESFVPEEDLFETDWSKLSSDNWMSGISGERYINEINLPCTHDSGCNEVDGDGLVSESYDRYAKTQWLYIDEQLDAGIRRLDIRLNNWHTVGTKNLGATVKWQDDGENLWLCHGKEAGGHMVALDKNGKDLCLKQVLTWVKDFLKEHPTEFVVLDFAPELNTTSVGVNKTDRDMKKVSDILYWELVDLSNEINPSTGKPYLYKESNTAVATETFPTYTRYPKLKECRGQILIQCDDFDEIHGLDFGAIGKCEGDSENKCWADEKVKRTIDFFEDHQVSLPTDATTHFDFIYSVGTTTSGPMSNYVSDRDRPVDLAAKIHKELFEDGKLFDEDGRYFGWVRLDGARAKQAKYIWDSNFFDGLQYCTITVKPGISSTSDVTQTYKLLKGTPLTIPNCIYSYDADVKGADFINWKGETAQGSEIYSPGQTITVEEDMTFTGQWVYDSTTLQIVWKDGDNADRLRPKSLTIGMDTDTNGINDSYTFDVSEKDGWSIVLSDSVKSVAPIWRDRIRPYYSDTSKGGQDAAGLYRYEVTGNQRNGYTITLYHTPDKKITVRRTAKWGDNENQEGLRPKSIQLYLLKNGETVDSQTVTAADGWKYDFGSRPLYENGETIEYSLAEDDIDQYTAFFNGTSVTNVLTTAMSDFNVFGLVTWVDDENANNTRPESVTVRLLADDKEVATQNVSANEEGFWSWGFGDLPEYDDTGKQIVYNVIQDPVAGHDTEMLSEDGFEIRNTLVGTNTVTFDSNGGTAVAPQVVARGACAKEPEKPAKEGMAFLGWKLVKDGQAENHAFDFSTPITEDTTLLAYFTDPHELGADRYEIVTQGNAPEIDSQQMYDVVGATLTQEEIDADHILLLVSSPLDEKSVPEADRAALTGKADELGAEASQWFDISLYNLGEGEQVKLDKAGASAKFTVKVPEALRADGRTYALLQCADGEARVVATGAGETLEWETDAVGGTYLLVANAASEGNVMYRLYNPNSGEHFYTADAAERDAVQAAGWNYEGEAWTAPKESAVPVYRLYNSFEPLGDHHYTTDKTEYDSLVELGWTGEGIGWYSDEAKGTAMLRLYNPNAYPMGLSGAHHYTADKAEADSLVALGWSYEGEGWYGLAS